MDDQICGDCVEDTLGNQPIVVPEGRKESPNHICNDCLLWQKFGDTCWVFWEKKRFCTQRVVDMDSWKEQQRLLK